MSVENLYYIPLILVAVALYKAASNYYYLRRTRTMHKLHDEYVRELAMPEGEGNPSWTFVKKTSEITGLFKRAGIQDSVITRLEPLGYGKVMPQEMSVFKNLSNDDSEVQTNIRHFFHEAEGVYQKRISESINVFYWIETILFLPARLAQYAGAPVGSWITRTANVVGWLIGVAGFIFALPDFQDARVAFSTWLGGIVRWVD